MLVNMNGTNSLTNLLRIEAADCPSIARRVTEETWKAFTIVAWLRTDPDDYPAPPPATQEIHSPCIFVDSTNNGNAGLRLLTNVNPGTVQARYRVGTSNSQIVLAGVFQRNEWNLITYSHRITPSRQVALTHRAESDGSRNSNTGTPSGDLTVVDRLDLFGGRFRGAMLMYVVDYVITTDEFDAIFAAGSPTAPLGSGVLSVPGGATGVIWSPGMTIPSQVNNHVVAGAVPSLIGDTVNANNLCIYHDETGVTNTGDIRTPRDVTIGGDCDIRHESPFEGGIWAGRFTRRVTAGVSPDMSDPGISPVARRLAMNAPKGVERIIVPSNSRGVRGVGANTSGVPRTLAENHAHGLAQVIRSNVGGVEIPVFVGTGAFFGVNGKNYRTTGTNASVQNGANAKSFSRLWFGNSRTGGTGAIAPGVGVYLEDGASIAPHVEEEEGSLLTDDRAIDMYCRLVRFPAAGVYRLQPNWAFSESVAGIDYGTEVELNGNTQVMARNVAAEDTIGNNTFSLTGASYPAWSLVENGMACFNTATKQFNVIATIALTNIDKGEDTCDVSITFEQDWLTNPSTGNLMCFGEVELVAVPVRLPVTSANALRRSVITMDGGSGVALTTWTQAVGVNDQWVVVSGGWSGNGYKPQMDTVSDADFARMVSAMDAKLWALVKAEQGSTFPADLVAYTERIRDTQPNAEIIWLAGQEVGNASFDTAAIANATANGVIAASAWPSALSGDVLEQFADGQRADAGGTHPSFRGHVKSAERWIEQLSTLALAAPSGGGSSNKIGVIGIGSEVAPYSIRRGYS